ncbi:unnamed protein product [Rotaria sordida]|uniref:Hypervirulence associated protein TUDOR domain-containing protein n=1 Tax=Rotaria sordida TaxID=392033 RepID=A0A814J136_9BILA|nr:unnamed protein product [Rotaria sordida]CAF1041196.1 unnamed protein product [Rotaria sordida]CAF3761532.1 unnamed protein product [Rotaria sordida]CAF3882360.1 unnamed protein product [Rotaria sordida]
MAAKRKRSSSTRTSQSKKTSNKKSTKKVNINVSSDDKPTTNSIDRKDIKKSTRRTKGSEQVKYNLGQQVQYDPVHKGSTRRAQGKVTKVLTGAKKSDPSTKEVRYVIENDNTGKETIYGQHSVKKKLKN